MTNSSLPTLQKHTLSDPTIHKMVTWIVCQELSDQENSTYKAIIHDDDLDPLLFGFLGPRSRPYALQHRFPIQIPKRVF